MIGKTLGHYSIVAKMGAGGMGEVYKARDHKLERDVALKILPAGSLIDESARKRFRKEALALSKLNHPNIATIYDFDSVSGVDFIAMELVTGETLAEKVAIGALPEKEVVALGNQIADALEEAHEHGIVHRDLKPANVMVTAKGRVKVLDFGLAKLVQPAVNVASAETLSQTQGVSGTLRSPNHGATYSRLESCFTKYLPASCHSARQFLCGLLTPSCIKYPSALEHKIRVLPQNWNESF
jgi:serine/threonine protein kinase